jgi:hypothetical protein
MVKAEAWPSPLGIALWGGIAILTVEMFVLASRPLGYYPEVAGRLKGLVAYIGPVWPLLFVTAVLMLACALALLGHRTGLLVLQRQGLALEMLQESGQWAMLCGLLGTFLGLIASLQAIDGRIPQDQMLAMLMQGTGTAIGSTVVSTVEGLVASVATFLFSRLWLAPEGGATDGRVGRGGCVSLQRPAHADVRPDVLPHRRTDPRSESGLQEPAGD